MNRLVRIFLFLNIARLFGAYISAQQAPFPTPTVSKGTATLLSLFKPVYPPLARQANIWGDVKVAVTVHPDGTAEATLDSGHPMLRQAAIDSASQSHFECQMCDSQVSYVLVYSFKQVEGPDCCSAFSAPVAVEQEAQSTDEQGHPQTHVTITAEQICICDPASTLTAKTRSIKCLYLWRCSAPKHVTLE